MKLSDMADDLSSTLFTEEQIQAKIDELAARIDAERRPEVAVWVDVQDGLARHERRLGRVEAREYERRRVEHEHAARLAVRRHGVRRPRQAAIQKLPHR